VGHMFMIDVVGVKPLDGHKLELTFQEGLNAVVDLDRVITRFEGIFAPLKEPEYFRSVRVDPEAGTVVLAQRRGHLPRRASLIRVGQADNCKRRAGIQLTENPG
jgi:hypothetical protein